MSDFHTIRRQQFLGVNHAEWMERDCTDGAANIETLLERAMADTDWDYAADRAGFRALLLFQRLVLRYTAGHPIDPLRAELGEVISAYERYGDLLWKHTGDRNEWVFDFNVLDDYCQLMQMVGLCFLLHRRDLLPRLAAMQDGDKGASGGADVIFEEFMVHVVGPDSRYNTDHACQIRPYENLFYALTEVGEQSQLKELHLFLKHWYKDLAGLGWHDSHKPDENGHQGGYYGYWSFEAGAAVLLLGIDDDSTLHKYLYYPKDLVQWARDHATLSVVAEAGEQVHLRCQAGERCPKDGFWFTPAQVGSRRHFNQGEVMPEAGGDYGATIWQWDQNQASLKS